MLERRRFCLMLLSAALLAIGSSENSEVGDGSHAHIAAAGPAADHPGDRHVATIPAAPAASPGTVAATGTATMMARTWIAAFPEETAIAGATPMSSGPVGPTT
jgi:hypothetical protein